MKTTPSIEHAITARLNQAAIKINNRTRSQLEAYLCTTLKVADALKALSDQRVYEICKPPAQTEVKETPKKEAQ